MTVALERYYANNCHLRHGLPTVAVCAEELCITANYLGEIIRLQTGDTAIRFIGRFIISKAKSHLMEGKSISETAYSLGFDFPSHLTRMFRRIEGISPSQYVKKLKSK